MRRLLGLVCLGFVVLPASAEEKPTKTADTFEELRGQFDAAQKKWTEERQELVKALREAKTDEEKKDIQKKLLVKPSDTPGAKFAPRFFEFAQQHPKDPAVYEAIALALRYSGGAGLKDGLFGKIVAHLQANCVTDPGIKSVLRNLAHANDEAATKLVRDVMARNTDRKVQALACKALLSGMEGATQLADRLKDETFRAQVEKSRGLEFVQKAIAAGEKVSKQTEELKALLKDRYAGLVPMIGSPAPEFISHGLDGKEVKLSSLKGKVVVIDIWATWCPPCRAMIPHEREMVERLKDKPFALVSVSFDEKMKTLTDFLEKEKMPWTHWWNGAQGGMADDWSVEHYPTIYVVDAKGVIRFAEIRGEKLEEAVNKLIEEAQKK